MGTSHSLGLVGVGELQADIGGCTLPRHVTGSDLVSCWTTAFVEAKGWTSEDVTQNPDVTLEDHNPSPYPPRCFNWRGCINQEST